MNALSRPSASVMARRRADELLALPHLRLHLILAALCCMTFWIGSIYISECAFNVVPWAQIYADNRLLYVLLDVVYYTADGLIILLLGLPLIYGGAMMFEGAARGVREPMSTLFCAFESPRRYRRALGVTLGVALLPAVFWALCALFAYQVRWAESPGQAVLILLYAVLPWLALSLGWGRYDAVLTLAYEDPDATVRELFARSRALTKGRLWSLLRFKSSFVGWALLSVLSLGLVLIFHALPHFSLSYSLYLTADRDNTPTQS